MSDTTGTDPRSDDDRTVVLGEQLVRIHDILRGELASVREGLDAVRGTGAPRPLEEQLRKKCLSFCEFLHGHHTAEDERMFPGLAESHPHLAPVLERLSREHSVISRSLDRIQELVASGEPAAVREDVERLAAEIEAHLDYEEAQIVEALNSYGPVRV
ncbi:hemerythrin domain-containing protein [Nocardiopsis aegyptia]|uniref:Hemerythrin-like domain-containing protein n=1 Tax=Nocardiopsis aegyptia TaxID=220378 RepID=A0A7Z0EIN4_9ACTN|nr:hemerythrin domain-containing protein [Nocardiopsis aegyptia]NYJ32667.1 hemerythrin-like domain-containing protein [Nocardiopsis aegyptia]